MCVCVCTQREVYVQYGDVGHVECDGSFAGLRGLRVSVDSSVKRMTLNVCVTNHRGRRWMPRGDNGTVIC